MTWRGWRRRASVGGGGPVRWGDIISFFVNPCLIHVHRKVFFYNCMFHRLDWLWVEVGGEAWYMRKATGNGIFCLFKLFWNITYPSYKGGIYYLKGPNLIIKTTSPNIFWLSNTCLSKCNIKLLATFGNSKNGLLVTFRILPNGLTLAFTKIVDQMSTYFKGPKTWVWAAVPQTPFQILVVPQFFVNQPKKAGKVGLWVNNICESGLLCKS